MYNESIPEYVVDQQGYYYPASTYYGTGFESAGEWEDQRYVFGLAAPEIQYCGGENEVLQPVYYTPSYGYAQSLYDPYNLYVPGSAGVDASYIEAPQYYTVPNCQDLNSSSPAYIPIALQPNTGVALNKRSDRRSSEHGRTSLSTTIRKDVGQSNSLTQSEWTRANVGRKHSLMHGSLSSSGARAVEGKGSGAAVEDIPARKVLPLQYQPKAATPIHNGFPGRNAVDKIRSHIHVDRYSKYASAGPNALLDKNSGPRTTNKWQGQLTVKAYTNKIRVADEQGNIIVNGDHYNRSDFSTDYGHAKFFIIKSYSEDDVHKSIKYKVWSSTQKGNRKLQNAYEGAQKMAAEKKTGCPVFLFFSVNASGQFCGLAEMTGPVDFNKDMDFWQQEKWSGSFSVKWHIIKDVPNNSCRHIVLKNNENNPVTFSRDTQEIMYKQGLEMLKVFKNYVLRTSILDDLIYYENREKIMQVEKMRHMFKRYENPCLENALNFVEQSASEEEKPKVQNSTNSVFKAEESVSELVSFIGDVAGLSITSEKDCEQTIVKEEDDITPIINFGSLNIDPKQVEARPPCSKAAQVDMVAIGSMPVKVFSESYGILTVGTNIIPINAITPQHGTRF